MKVTAPFYSTSASGKFAGVLAYSRGRRRTSVSRIRRPTQPRTEAQVATRLFTAFMAKQWATLSIANLATWAPLGKAQRTSAYHAYMRYNISRYAQLPGERYYVDDYDVGPTVSYPADQSTDAAVITDHVSYGLVNSSRTNLTFSPHNDNWIVVVHRQPEPGPWPIYANLIGIFLSPGAGAHDFYCYNLPAGTYKIRYCSFSRSSKQSAYFLHHTITVTDP